MDKKGSGSGRSGGDQPDAGDDDGVQRGKRVQIRKEDWKIREIRINR